MKDPEGACFPGLGHRTSGLIRCKPMPHKGFLKLGALGWAILPAARGEWPCFCLALVVVSEPTGTMPSASNVTTSLTEIRVCQPPLHSWAITHARVAIRKHSHRTVRGFKMLARDWDMELNPEPIIRSSVTYGWHGHVTGWFRRSDCTPRDERVK